MSLAEHDARVRTIVGRLGARSVADGFASLRKESVSHYVPDPHDPRHVDHKLDVRELTEILAIDVERRVCVAEPGVTFAELLRATLLAGVPYFTTIAAATAAVDAIEARRTSEMTVRSLQEYHASVTDPG